MRSACQRAAVLATSLFGSNNTIAAGRPNFAALIFFGTRPLGLTFEPGSRYVATHRDSSIDSSVIDDARRPRWWLFGRAVSADSGINAADGPSGSRGQTRPLDIDSRN